MTISLCMIVKNEEKNLARCLDSIKDLMDEIIILDTGSTDRTIEIAKKYTKHVHSYTWIHDFAHARNTSFSYATMDYIYMADADEVLDSENRQKFLDMKKTLLPEIEIVQMWYCNQLHHGTVYNFDEELRPKLFRRVRHFYFEDPVHETVVLEPVIYDSDIKITHLPENNHANRDFSIFTKLYTKEKRLSSRLHTLYAKELLMCGTDADFIAAIPIFERTLSDSTRNLNEIKEATCILARAFRIQNDLPLFFKYALKNTACESCCEVCYELGEYFFSQKDYEEAAIWFYNARFETECILCLKYKNEYAVQGLIRCYEAMDIPEKVAEYQALLEE